MLLLYLSRYILPIVNRRIVIRCLPHQVVSFYIFNTNLCGDELSIFTFVYIDYVPNP